MSKTGSGPFRVARACDLVDAITNPDMYGKYLSERDFDVLKIDPDKKIPIYHCRPLTVPERREVRNKTTPGDQFEAAFVRSVVRVENLVDGHRVREWQRVTDNRDREMNISDQELADLFDEATVQEIGSVVLSKSFLAHSTSLSCALPDISRSALQAALHHLAVRTADAARSAKSKTTAEDTSGSTPTSSPDSATPGVVIVMAPPLSPSTSPTSSTPASEAISV